jgi:hypothetical protein
MAEKLLGEQSLSSRLDESVLSSKSGDYVKPNSAMFLLMSMGTWCYLCADALFQLFFAIPGVVKHLTLIHINTKAMSANIIPLQIS